MGLTAQSQLGRGAPEGVSRGGVAPVKSTGAWSGRSVEELKRLSPGGASLGKGRGPGRCDWDLRNAAKPGSGVRHGQGRGEEGVGGVTGCRGSCEGRGQEAGAGSSGSMLSRLCSGPQGARPLPSRDGARGDAGALCLPGPVLQGRVGRKGVLSGIACGRAAEGRRRLCTQAPGPFLSGAGGSPRLSTYP